MHLYWAARERGNHYLENQCRAWQDALDNFRYTEIVNNEMSGEPAHIVSGVGVDDPGSTPPASPDYLINTARQVVRDYPDLSGHDVYVSGPVHAMTYARALLLEHHLPEERLFVDALERF